LRKPFSTSLQPLRADSTVGIGHAARGTYKPFLLTLTHEGAEAAARAVDVSARAELNPVKRYLTPGTVQEMPPFNVPTTEEQRQFEEWQGLAEKVVAKAPTVDVSQLINDSIVDPIDDAGPRRRLRRGPASRVGGKLAIASSARSLRRGPTRAPHAGGPPLRGLKEIAKMAPQKSRHWWKNNRTSAQRSTAD